MKPIIKYILITASRDFLFLGIFILMIIAIMLSKFIGSTAISEQEQMQLTYVAASSRLIINVGLMLFICFNVRRSFENKEIELFLSKPISRQKFIASYQISFIILALIISLTSSILIYFTNPIAGKSIIWWFLSIFCENIIIISFTILASFMLSSAINIALFSLSFYFLARMMGFFMAGINIDFTYLSIKNFAGSILMFCSVFLPRLDLFSKSEWLIYHNYCIEDFKVILFTTLIYPGLLFFATMIDFKSKEF